MYIETQPNESYTIDNNAPAFAQRLVQPNPGSGRNVTFDNWFTSISFSPRFTEKIHNCERHDSKK